MLIALLRRVSWAEPQLICGSTLGLGLERYISCLQSSYLVSQTLQVLVLGVCLQVVGFAIQSSAPPFPAFVLGFPINGFGMSLQDAQANGYVAALRSETKMGVLHAVYGLGALAAPLVATQFAQMEKHWSLHYVTSVFVALVTLVVLAAMFKGKSQTGTTVI